MLMSNKSSHLPAELTVEILNDFSDIAERMTENHNKRPRGLDDLLGHLLVKRTPVMYKFSNTKIPEYLSQK